MKEIDMYFTQAEKCIEAKNFTRALRLFLKIERIKKGISLLNIGNLYSDYSFFLGKKHIKKSLKYYKQSAMLGDSNAMLNIAITYKSFYKIKKAKKWLKKSINHNNIEASLNLAKIYLEEGKVKKAIKYLNNIKNAKSYINVSESSQQEAIKILKNIINGV